MSYSAKCKSTSTKLELNWWNGGTKKKGCWRKKINGRQYYFFHPDTRPGYETALLHLAQTRARVDEERPNAAVFHQHKKLFLQVRTYWEQFGCPDFERKLAGQVDEFIEWIDDWLRQAELPSPIPLGAFSFTRPEFRDEFVGEPYSNAGTDQYELPPKWLDRLDRLAAESPCQKRPQAIRYWIDTYLAELQEKASVNQRSPKTFASARQHLSIFRRWVGEENHVKRITASKWSEFYRHILLLKLSPSSKRGYLNAARTWVKWAWRQEECQLTALPANVDDRSLSFVEIGTDDEAHRARIRRLIWTPDEFHKALELLDDRWRCWLWLFLNCGFTQTDLNDLRQHEIDLEAGRLIHRRTKTKRRPNPPLVNYLLWDETKAAIRKVISDDPEIAFFTEKGSRLTPRTTVKKDGKLCTVAYDNLARDWQRKCESVVGLPDKLLKGLRKTGSTTLKSNAQYGWLRVLYLGNTGKIADKHYDANDGRIYPSFDEAVTWLGEQFRRSHGNVPR